MDPMLCMIFPWPANWAPMDYQFCQGQTIQLQQYTAVYSLLGTIYGGNGSSNFMLPNLTGRAAVGAQYQQTVKPYGLAYSGGSETATGTIGSVSLTPANTPVPVHTHTASFAPVSGPQSVTIPATAAAGSLTGTGTMAAVAGIDAAGVPSPVAGSNYYLTGAAAKAPSALSGLYTPTAPGAGNTANIKGGNVTITPSSDYHPAMPAQTVSINSVTNGSVTVNPTAAGTGTSIPVSGAVPTISPYLALNFLIAMQGIYPQRP